MESSDSSDSQIIVTESLESPSDQTQNGQQVTAQVAVLQAQASPNGGQHFITVSGNLSEYKFYYSL